MLLSPVSGAAFATGAAVGVAVGAGVAVDVVSAIGAFTFSISESTATDLLSTVFSSSLYPTA